MKKISFLIGTFAAAVLLAAVLGLFASGNRAETGESKEAIAQPYNDTAPKYGSESTWETIEEHMEPKYIVKENKEGKIDVYLQKGEEMIFLKTINFDCSTLRQADRVILQNGIYVESEEEAMMLLEDFTS
ncbi:MAG: hypothetical protein Q8882_03100 [Bacillota bacterium]|nr:hypothetical protein [Bacillota bacterium]